MVVRALSASRVAVPRGVRGRARAREHTWALREMCLTAYARAVRVKIVEIKNYSSGGSKSLLVSLLIVGLYLIVTGRQRYEVYL